MSTFCRITGRSHGLPKPNYFPLLPPISPADAKRLCRITGKSYGLPAHHYIPVTLISKTKRKRGNCKITSNEAVHKFTPAIETNDKRKRHVVLCDYRYVFPVLKGSSTQQKTMMELLTTKDGRVISFPEEDSRFVYVVEERQCSLVLPSALEAAVRDGDIRDIMLSKDSDTVLFKLKEGRNISLDFENVTPKIDKSSELYDGEGPNADVVKELETEEMNIKKRKRKLPDALASMKKVFEEKEKEAETEVRREVELNEMKKAKVVEKIKADIKEKVEVKEKDGQEEKKEDDVMTEEEERAAILNNWKRFDPRHSRAETSLVMCSGDWRDLIKPLIEDWNWDAFNSESVRTPIINTLPEPVPIQAQVIDLGLSLPGIVQSQTLGENGETAGFEPIPSVAPFTPLMVEPEAEVTNAVLKLQDPDILEKTSYIQDMFFEAKEEVKSMVPKVNEIPDLVTRIEQGVVTELVEGGRKIQGLVLDIEAAKRFVVGQTVETPKGTVFVPGQTLQTPSGPQFVPGFTIRTPGVDSLVLIPGQRVLAVTEESGGNAVPVFVAGQTLITREGEKFVAGQTVHTSEGPRFMAGQTVITPDGPKFIPGQLVLERDISVQPNKSVIEIDGEKKVVETESKNVHKEGTTQKYKFVPGQTILTSDGPKFVPGQTVATAQGEEIFIAGQNIQTKDGNWEFVPGQTVGKGDEVKFVAGQTVMTPEGPKFIPGQIVNTMEGCPQFVPGVTVLEKDGTTSKFVPGKALQTQEGAKFVEGQLLKTASGETSFVPGKTYVTENNGIRFTPAKKLEEIVLNEVIEVPKEGLKPINPCSGLLPSPDVSSLFGHVVQTLHGVEFFPGQSISGLPAGKIVPGKLERAVDGKVKFVPGTVIEIEPGTENFVPGQVVMTDRGEQFVPGQVVETSEGAKFVPGQVIETRTGQKFIPGQTMETSEGTRFVPGQIVDTKAGPTFIPGQVISTEEGSKFVPGEVLDTEEGPRFVPGRVIETEDDRVKFVPGQTVRTKDGSLRFVAPDLQDTPEGGFEFSVQGFEITPEELQLLRPMQVTASYVPASEWEMSIDSRMLRQLSQAGMSLGRQVSLDIPTVDFTPKRVTTACNVDGTIPEENINKLEILKHILSDQQTEESVMEKLSTVLKHTKVVHSGKEESKADTRERTLESAFRHLSHGNPEFLERVLQKVSEYDEDLVTEKDPTGTLQRAIIAAVQEHSEQQIREMLQYESISKEEEVSDEGGSRGLLMQAVGLARALGLSDVVAGLLDVLSDPQSTRVLASDSLTMDILRRLTVMRQLAEQQPSLCVALRLLQSDPEIAKSDPRLRELVRESAALLVAPEEDRLPLESSNDIPSVLFHSNNILAMEEFLFSRNQRSSGTLLILKQGLQAIIPRENARAVLTGQIPYTVLDETGIRHFEPLHVFSALRLPRQAAYHFSIYSCPVAKEELTYTAPTLTPQSSSDYLAGRDSRRRQSDTTTTTTTTSRRRGTLDSVDGSTLNYTRLNGSSETQSVTSGYNTPTSRRGRRCDDGGYSHFNGEGSLTPPSGYSTPKSRSDGNGEKMTALRGKSYSTTFPGCRKLSRSGSSVRVMGSEVSVLLTRREGEMNDRGDCRDS